MPKNIPHSLSANTMREVWRASRDSRRSTSGKPGIDNISPEVFSSDLDAHIRSIQREIKSDSFEFRRLRVAPIPKASGGFRIIAVPTVRDRFVQRVVLRHLEGDKRFPPPTMTSYGFVKNRTLQDAQRRACELRNRHPWVLQADIVKFFDQIDRRILSAKVEKAVRSKTIRALILKAILCELDESNSKGLVIAEQNGIKKGRGLRQGMPISPVLSNLLLRDFDQAIASANIVAIRYADDIAVFADSESECRAALYKIRDLLSGLRLDIPELKEGGKTTLADPSKSVEFLGVDVRRFSEGYRLCAPFKKLQTVDEKMGELSNVEFCAENEITLVKALRTLNSMTIGYERSLAIVSDREAFAEKLRGLEKKHSERLLISIFGKKVFDSLTPDKLAVLGVSDFPKKKKTRR